MHWGTAKKLTATKRLNQRPERPVGLHLGGSAASIKRQWMLHTRPLLCHPPSHPKGVSHRGRCTDFFLSFFFFLHLYWSIIALQWCVSFCCITK